MKLFRVAEHDPDGELIVQYIFTDLSEALKMKRPIFFTEKEGVDIFNAYSSMYEDELEWLPYTGEFIVDRNCHYENGKYFIDDENDTSSDNAPDGDRIEVYLDGKFIKDYFKPY